ncbi:alpha-L-fucosidase [Planctomycetota bacterium]
MTYKLFMLWLGLTLSVFTVFGDTKPVSQPRDDFLNWQFGMFIHFNVATFNEREWANGYEDPATFAPDKLDCHQWAEAASAARMQYAVLTVKHTGGWCLWDSAHTDTHDVGAFLDYMDGKGDIVREYVEAFRKRGIKVGLYYCFPGDYAGKHGSPPPPKGKEDLHGLPPEAKADRVGFMKKQLTELLTQYGKIDLLWIDQYSNKYTYNRWQEILKHVKSHQPNCLVLANNSLDYKDTDIHGYEYPWMVQKNPAKALPPEDNKNPAEVCDKIGPGWFWSSREKGTNLKSAEEAVNLLKLCNSRRANYLLNVAPDKSGQIPDYAFKCLQELGDLLGTESLSPSKKTDESIESNKPDAGDGL